MDYYSFTDPKERKAELAWLDDPYFCLNCANSLTYPSATDDGIFSSIHLRSASCKMNGQPVLFSRLSTAKNDCETEKTSRIQNSNTRSPSTPTPDKIKSTKKIYNGNY